MTDQQPAEITDEAPRARWIDTAEVARLIRKHLKPAFPGITFSVRLQRYAGGSSINVRWTDGPTVKQVKAITYAFSGARFEGMTDCAYSANSWYCAEHAGRVAETYGCDLDLNNDVRESRCCGDAELVHFGASYVFENRNLSPEFTTELAAKVRKDSGMSADGRMTDLLPEGSRWQYNPYDSVANGVYRLSVETTCSS